MVKVVGIAGSLRDALKGDLTELLTNNPSIDGRELTARTIRMIDNRLEKLATKMASEEHVISWSKELGSGMSQLLQAGIEHRNGARDRDRGSNGRGTATRSQTHSIHER